MMRLTPNCARRAAILWCTVAVIAFGCWPASALASQITDTDDFADIFNAVLDYADEVGPERVLLVLDIDNTLLAMQQPLGSDQWFEWQKYLIESEPDSPHAVADSFEGLLDAQGILYNLGRMRAPQEDLPGMIRRLQRMGIHTVVLTARGDEYRVATERELKRVGYDFSKSALPVRDLPGGTFQPYDLDDLKSSGLTEQEVTAFRLGEPKPVSYSNGIMMTAGQSKGAMLLALLHHADADIEAVVYDDDNIRHVGFVFAAVAGRGDEITAFHYTREDENVKRFQYGSKKDVTERWRKLNGVLDEVFAVKAEEDDGAEVDAKHQSNGSPKRVNKKLRGRMPARAGR